MTSINKGFVAGLIATVVLSIIMIVKAGLGLLPDFNAISSAGSAIS